MRLNSDVCRVGFLIAFLKTAGFFHIFLGVYRAKT